jgi:hypothetical protein
VIGLIAKSWLGVTILAALAGVALEKTNEWVPEPGAGEPYTQSHEGLQVAQRLTDAELLRIVAVVESAADPAVLARIRNQTGWDVTPTTAMLAQKMFRDMEWASRKACLWCRNPKQTPEDFPHYRVHRPNCLVDMICSGLVRSDPMQEGEWEIWWTLQASPASGYVWSSEYDAWVSAPDDASGGNEAANMTLDPPEFPDDPGAETSDQTRFEQE